MESDVQILEDLFQGNKHTSISHENVNCCKISGGQFDYKQRGKKHIVR